MIFAMKIVIDVDMEIKNKRTRLYVILFFSLYIFVVQVHILSVILLHTERAEWLRRSARGRCRGDGAQSVRRADEVLTGPEGREETCECQVHTPETPACSGAVQDKYYNICLLCLINSISRRDGRPSSI